MLTFDLGCLPSGWEQNEAAKGAVWSDELSELSGDPVSYLPTSTTAYGANAGPRTQPCHQAGKAGPPGILGTDRGGGRGVGNRPPMRGGLVEPPGAPGRKASQGLGKTRDPDRAKGV